jgi:excisionase family DNA binding protein
MLALRQAAERLGVNPWTLRKYISIGYIRANRVGERFYFDEDTLRVLEAWFRRNEAFLTPATLARVTGLPYWVVWKNIVRGHLLAERVFGRYIIRPEDAARWLESQ